MKKFLVSILAFVYLTSTVGATLRLDCCLENLVHTGWEISAQESEWRSATDNCNDDHKQAKPGHEQKRTDSKIRVAKFVPASLNTHHPEYSFHPAITIREAYPVNNRPPHLALLPLFMLNCVHRI